MIDYEKIEQYVCDLLTVMGVSKDGEEQSLWLFLHHACCAAAIYEVLDDGMKPTYKELLKRLSYFFTTKISLKERKGRKAKESFPPNPLIKEIKKKSKEMKALPPAERGMEGRNRRLMEGLEARREVFRQECLRFRGSCADQHLASFFNYWSEANESTGKMRFEEQRYWSIDKRLSRWVNKSYAAADTAAAIRLKKTQQKMAQAQTAAEQAQEAREVREQENAEREARAEESRQTQMLTDEYVKAHPDSLMAKIYKKTKT
jgi:hypothetical protein